MPIPLLRFPILVSMKIAKDLDIVDLTAFLQLSTRAKNLVKLTKTHIKLKVFRDRFQFAKLNDPVTKMEVYFVSGSDSTPNQRKLTFKPITNETTKPQREHDIEEYRRMMDNFVDIFIVIAVSFELKDATFNSSFSLIEYAKNVRLKLDHIELCLFREKNGNYQKLLSLCSDASELNAEMLRRRRFPLDGFDQFKMDRLILRCSDPIKWFSIDCMCALVNCSSVTVYFVKWTMEIFNKFLKFWIASDGKLNEFALSNHIDINPQNILYGINNMRITHDQYEIQRANGVRARVSFATRKIVVRVNDV